MTPEEALVETIRIAGGPAAVARAFDPPIRTQAVSQWSVAPPERCRRLAELTGGEISVHQLRPDIFGEPPAGQGAPGQERAAA